MSNQALSQFLSLSMPDDNAHGRVFVRLSLDNWWTEFYKTFHKAG